MDRIIQLVSGLLIAAMLPMLVAGWIAMAQGIQFQTIIYAIVHGEGFYNTYYQVGVAANIGIFFLVMSNPRLLNFGRGWLIGTILNALWTIIIDLNWFT
jgi:hypothetical protein